MSRKQSKSTVHTSDDSEYSEVSTSTEDKSDHEISNNSDTDEDTDQESFSDDGHDMMSLYREIIDDDYSRGKYVDFDVIIMRNNGYINATQLCNSRELNFADWSTTSNAIAFVDTLAKTLKNPLQN